MQQLIICFGGVVYHLTTWLPHARMSPLRFGPRSLKCVSTAIRYYLAKRTETGRYRTCNLLYTNRLILSLVRNGQAKPMLHHPRHKKPKRWAQGQSQPFSIGSSTCNTCFSYAFHPLVIGKEAIEHQSVPICFLTHHNCKVNITLGVSVNHLVPFTAILGTGAGPNMGNAKLLCPKVLDRVQP